MAVRKWLIGKSRGSLIPLSFGFFLIAMSLSFISINISSAYATKKELTNIGEAAINKAAQSINLLAYYAEINRFSNNKRVPLDCLAANTQFHNLISQTLLSNRAIRVDRFDCDLYEVKAVISISGRLPIDIPFFNLNQMDNLQITTTVGASSAYIPN